MTRVVSSLACGTARFDASRIDRLLVLVLVVTCFWVGRAAAQTQPKVELHWRGDACGPPQNAEREVARLLGQRYANLSRTAFSAEVTQLAAAEFQLMLAIVEAAPGSARVVRFSSCAEVREAAVLLMAMALDPSLALAEPPGASPPAANEPIAPEPELARRKVPWRGELALGGMVDLWNLPHPGAGPDLGAMLMRRGLLLGLHARYLIAAETHKGLPAGSAAGVQLAAAAIELGGRFERGRWSFSPTSELELGFIEGSGTGVAGAQRTGTFWASVWAGLGASLRVHRRVSLYARTLGGLSVRRPSFALRGDSPFFTVPAASMRFFMGLSFWLGPTD